MPSSLSLFFTALRKACLEAKWLFALVIGYILLALAYIAAIDQTNLRSLLIYTERFALFYAMVLPSISAIWVLTASIVMSPKDPSIYCRNACQLPNVAHWLVGLLLIVLLTLFWAAFAQVKNSLSIGGFTHDVMLANIERWLHGGTDPTVWMATHITNHFLLLAVQFNYNVVWQILHLLVVCAVLLCPTFKKIRLFYMTLYVVGWLVLGNILAGAFISGGPTYYGAITGDSNRYAALETLLETTKTSPHSAYQLQQYLWASRTLGEANLGTGISAFPSIHIYIVVLNALFLYHFLSRKLGRIAAVYAGLIVLSSAYLGWHYLIDGYASTLFALTFFYVGLRWHRKSH